LALQQSAWVPCGLGFNLVCSILLPAEVARIVPATEKGRRLGTAALMGAVAQLMQPVWGALSDRMRPTSRACGRRRVFVCTAQIAQILAMVMMAAAPLAGCPALGRYWLLAGGYTVFQLGNCMLCAPMYTIIPELVPAHQRGAAGGWNNLAWALAGIAASFLGMAVGNGLLDTQSTYAIAIFANIVGLGLGVLAFSAAPGCCQLEAAPPPLPVPTKHALGRGNRCCDEVLGFLRPFRHPPMAAMFCFLLLQSVAGIVGTYFTQYYLQDVVEPHGFTLPGFTRPVAETAEAAVSLYTLAQSLAFTATALGGGYLGDRLGQKRWAPG
jgi:MFS family permease